MDGNFEYTVQCVHIKGSLIKEYWQFWRELVTFMFNEASRESGMSCVPSTVNETCDTLLYDC
jgi:hypothetical protein